MKRRTIWTIALIMAFSFVALIYTQVRYFEAIASARQEQFDETIGHVLFAASRSVELEETRATIEQEIDAFADAHFKQQQDELSAIRDSIMSLAEVDSSLNALFSTPVKTEADREKRREWRRRRLLYQKDLLNKAIYSIVYRPIEKPVGERLNFAELDRFIQTELHRHGIDIKYHISLSTYDGRELQRCSEYEEPGDAKVYRKIIYPNDPPHFQAVINIHFPHMRRYIYATAKFLFPALLFTFILLVTFVYTIWIFFRQKKLSEMKNDFVNNMTHELKTPISTISLAAQMLSDPVISKNETSLKRFSGVITDETKRLRFLVDKVLQTSLFEKGKAVTFKMDELDANGIIEEVASTFTVKVHNVGGTIETQLDAEDPIICADQMHFTNVIFNLLDNAYKYRKQDADAPSLQLKIRTANEGHKLKIYISDNGIGIKHDQLKNIFKKFYRVHTGDRHDVKGFGLGLAYVTSVVEAHKGKIHAESKLDEGTTFVITLPLIEE